MNESSMLATNDPLVEADRLYRTALETRSALALELAEQHLRQIGELLAADDLDRAFELAGQILTLRDLTPH